MTFVIRKIYMELKFCRLEEQEANIFIDALPKEKFHQLREVLGG